MKNKIIIVVRSGNVEVYTSDKNLEVELKDYDRNYISTEKAEKEFMEILKVAPYSVNLN